jgi:transcriptional regulator with XRE-family HTH domain
VTHLTGSALRRLRQSAGLSLRQLATIVHYSPSYLHDIETGRRQPSTAVAARITTHLGTWDDRLTWAAQHPTRVDTATLDLLTTTLADLRRLEDTDGPTTALPAARAHLTLTATLADTGPDRHRTALIDLTGQWQQLVGWLHAATGDRAGASAHYGHALAAALEVDRPDLAATALSMRGHLAWQARRPGPLISLTQAALRQPAGTAVRVVGLQQLARGHALAGRRVEAEAAMGEADDLAEQVTEAPPWLYFHTGPYLEMQRGLVCLLTGRPEAAAEAISAGLAGLDAAGAEWTDTWRGYLAAAVAGGFADR